MTPVDPSDDLDERVRALEREVRLGRMFGEVSAALTSNGSFADTMQRSAEAMVHFLGVASARIWQVDLREGSLRLRASAGVNAAHDTLGSTAAPGSVDGHPLQVAGHTLGVLSVVARQPLEADELETIAASANALALAIERHLSREVVREETEALEILNKVGQLLSAELDQQKLVQAITDHTTRLAGAEFGAFFYNVADERGETYMLYSLSGVPREAFAKFPMPRNTNVFAPTFAGEGVVRVDDITKDARYGHNHPHRGMPEGHLPVRSYLAAPVVSRSGTVLGGLFFGHSKPGVFTLRSEGLVAGVASQAAIAMDNARLFREAEAASRMREDVMAVVSHDLRNPLSAIVSSAALLSALLGDAAAPRKHLETIQRSADRMKRLVSDLLDIASIEAGRFVIELGQHRASNLVRESVDTFAAVAAEKSLRIEAGDMDESLNVHCDRERVLQVFSNLLGNAIKFTPASGGIFVGSSLDGDMVRFMVRDSGPGVDPSQMPRLFDRYWQAKRSSRTGLGLGLSISRGIVEAHGGTIWAESTLGNGTSFYFTLPMRPQASGRARHEPSAQ